MFLATAAVTDFAESIAALEQSTEVKLSQLLTMVGTETIAYLRSLTGEMRPPARRGENDRPAHPGHWADVTGNLANAYGFTVQETPDGPALVLYNTMEYAVYLEVRDGFFVLHGVTDPGGPVESALKAALAIVAPEWQVVTLTFQPFV